MIHYYNHDRKCYLYYSVTLLIKDCAINFSMTSQPICKCTFYSSICKYCHSYCGSFIMLNTVRVHLDLAIVHSNCIIQFNL